MGFWFSSSGPFTFEWDSMAPTLGSSVSPPGLLSPPAPTESDALGWDWGGSQMWEKHAREEGRF